MTENGESQFGIFHIEMKSDGMCIRSGSITCIYYHNWVCSPSVHTVTISKVLIVLSSLLHLQYVPLYVIVYLKPAIHVNIVCY